jgi:hypothetical protein
VWHNHAAQLAEQGRQKWAMAVVPGCNAGCQAGLAHSAGAAVQMDFELNPEFKSFKQIQTVSNFG